MKKTEKKNLKKGDLIQLKIVNLDTKGRAYGFFDENKIYVNINTAQNQVVEGIFVKRRRKYELIHCKIVDFLKAIQGICLLFIASTNFYSF